MVASRFGRGGPRGLRGVARGWRGEPPSRPWQVPRAARRMHRLPHARSPSRQAGHVQVLAGSDVGLEVPGLGVFVAPNLTPDKVTGLGNWTKEQIATAIQTGVRPDGRVLAPIMPWRAYAGLTKSDIGAIVEYLGTL